MSRSDVDRGLVHWPLVVRAVPVVVPHFNHIRAEEIVVSNISLYLYNFCIMSG